VVTRTVSCESCELAWNWVAAGGSVYEREAIESRPCPGCGAYTLTTPEPTPPMPTRWSRGATTKRAA